MSAESDCKVFCIGFQKTGTTSLESALQELGYSVKGPFGLHDPRIADNARSKCMKLSEKYDAFQDNPWPFFYKEFDEKYTNAKFILTIRSSGAWYESVLRHFGQESTEMRKWVYGRGSPVSNKEIYIKTFEDHNRDVKQYFNGRPEKLLVLNIFEGDGWDELCEFLGKKSPGGEFPRKNVNAAKGKKLRRVKQRIRRVFRTND